jgi:hypothetical protein
MDANDYELKRKALFNACVKGDLETLKLLIDYFKAPQGIENPPPSLLNEFLNEPFRLYDWTPLMVAAFNGHTNIVKHLISKEAGIKSHRYKIDIYWESSSGATVLDILEKNANKPELIRIIQKEDLRQKRLKTRPTKQGFHETDIESFKFILNDIQMNRYPMVGGDGGYFGGGVYFALSQRESSTKALHRGFGFECTLKMGNCLILETKRQVKYFYRDYCYTAGYRDYVKIPDENVDNPDATEADPEDAEDPGSWNDPYQIPIDVMQCRLLENDIDSVWGNYNTTTVKNPHKRILRSGDEIVIYSADQIDIEKYFIVNKETKDWIHLTNPIEKLTDLFNIPLISKNAVKEDIRIKDISYEPIHSMLAQVLYLENTYENPYKWSIQILHDYYPLENPQYLEKDNSLPSSQQYKLLFSPDGSTLFIAFKKNIQVYSMTSYTSYSIHRHLNPILSIAITPDGKYLFSVGKENECYIHTIEHKNPSATKIISPTKIPSKQLPDIKASLIACSQNPNVKTFAILSSFNYNRTVEVYTYTHVYDDEADTLAIKHRYTYTHSKPIKNILFTPNGDYVVLISPDSNIAFLDVESGKIKAVIDKTESGVITAAFSNDGRYLMAGFNDNLVIIWDIQDLSVITMVKIFFVLPIRDRDIEYVAFSKDGKQIIVCSAGSIVGTYIYDTSSLYE